MNNRLPSHFIQTLGQWFDQHALPFLVHLFRYAEVYTVVLVWLILPLGYWVCFRFFSTHFDMFLPRSRPAQGKDVKQHGSH